MVTKMLVALFILSSWNSPPAYTPKINCPSAIGSTSTKHDVTTSAIDRTGTAVATPSTSFALSVPLLSAEAMMPRDMRGFWSRALHPEVLPHSRFVRCDPPPLACIFYYCVICAAAFYMVALSPNDKTMRSRLGLALVLLLVGLPTAAALPDGNGGVTHDKANDNGPEASVATELSLTNTTAPSAPLSHVTRRLAVINVQPGPGTLQAALNNASAGDELVLADGIYSSTTGNQVVYISKSITIRALNPRGAIINGLDQRRCIAITNGTVVLEGLQVTFGRAGSSVSAPPTNTY